MTWVYYLSPPELRELYLTVSMIEVTFICGKVTCNVICETVAEWTYNNVKVKRFSWCQTNEICKIWNKSSVKKGWLKPETQRMHQHVEARAKLKSHIYTILLRSNHTCPQIQRNYIWSLDPQDIQGCLSQNMMRDWTCKTKVQQSTVYPLPGMPPLSSSVLQTFPVQQTCVCFSGWTNSSFSPALGGSKCHSQVVLSGLVLCLVSYKLPNSWPGGFNLNSCSASLSCLEILSHYKSRTEDESCQWSRCSGKHFSTPSFQVRSCLS